MKLMLVDDNKMFRAALRTMIDWEKYGYDLALEAINGVHALELLKDDEVDLVITDMSMPEMNGIELIRAIRATYPEVKVVALSNYDDFEFVKTALKLGALDYLLKHEVDSASLLSVLEGCKRMEFNTEVIRNQVRLQHKYLEIDSFVGKLFHGQMGFEEMKVGLLKYNERHRAYGDMAVLSIHYHQSDGKDYAFREWLHGMLNREDILLVAAMQRNSHILIANYYDERCESKIRSQLSNLINDLLFEAKSAGFNIGILVSDLGSGLKSLKNLYEQVMVVKDNMIYNRPKEVTYYATNMAILESINEPAIIIGNRIHQDDLQKNKDMFVEELKGIFERLRSVPVDSKSVDKVMFEITSIIPHMAKGIGANFFDVMDSQSNLYQLVEGKIYLAEKESLLLKVVHDLYELGTGNTLVNNNDIGDIMAYIEKNYHDELTLGSIAKKYRYSPNYLSSLFKQHAGVTLIEYVKEVRIRHAKVLILEHRYKTYEIAEKTGFRNTSYFCTVFKELVGLSPKEYRDKKHGSVK